MRTLFLIIILSLISGVIVGIKTTWQLGFAIIPTMLTVLVWIVLAIRDKMKDFLWWLLGMAFIVACLVFGKNMPPLIMNILVLCGVTFCGVPLWIFFIFGLFCVALESYVELREDGRIYQLAIVIFFIILLGVLLLASAIVGCFIIYGGVRNLVTTGSFFG